VQIVRIENVVNKIGTGVIHNVAYKISSLLNLFKYGNNEMKISENLPYGISAKSVKRLTVFAF
jgi:hypothetical protein